MSTSAIVQNGKIQETASETSVKKAATSNGMDKDAFLQLLVAQMKYQDPLEPTSNTEYISQYATFSQVEQMQNMAATMELSRASSMVGQFVEVETTSASGETKSIQGTVEYVAYENNKAYVSIDGSLYSVDDVVAVIDENYQTAYDLAVAFAKALNSLPTLANLTADDEEAVEALQTGFNSMTEYQQSFIANDYIKKLQQYVQRMSELTMKDEDAEESEETVETDSTDKVTEETGSTEEIAKEAGTEGTEGESV